jgi:peptidoglycan/LPS O-acetylase OafA/YrhL
VRWKNFWLGVPATSESERQRRLRRRWLASLIQLLVLALLVAAFSATSSGGLRLLYVVSACLCVLVVLLQVFSGRRDHHAVEQGLTGLDD